jgi:hypothetical protein
MSSTSLVTCTASRWNSRSRWKIGIQSLRRIRTPIKTWHGRTSCRLHFQHLAKWTLFWDRTICLDKVLVFPWCSQPISRDLTVPRFSRGCQPFSTDSTILTSSRGCQWFNTDSTIFQSRLRLRVLLSSRDMLETQSSARHLPALQRTCTYCRTTSDNSKGEGTSRIKECRRSLIKWISGRTTVLREFKFNSLIRPRLQSSTQLWRDRLTLSLSHLSKSRKRNRAKERTLKQPTVLISIRYSAIRE